LGGPSAMPVTSGTVFGNPVQFLRDTGCSAVVVKRGLVPGDMIVCVLIHGTARRTPVAMIEVDTPFFKRTVEAVCMRQPMYDLIIGNIPAIVGSSEEDSPQPAHNQALGTEHAVTTRARDHAQSTKRTKPLKVTKGLGEEITPEASCKVTTGGSYPCSAVAENGRRPTGPG